MSERLLSKESSRMFKPSDTLKDTDVERYLKQDHEIVVQQTISECSEDTSKSLLDSLRAVLESNLKAGQQQNQDDRGQQENRGGTAALDVCMLSPSAATIQQRASSYATVVSKLNDARARGEDFRIVENLAKVSEPRDTASLQQSPWKFWQLIEYFTGESEALQEPMEGRYLRSYGLRDSDRNVSTRITNRLLNASRKWLERQYRQFVDDTLAKRALDAKVGGDPSPAKRIHAFMNITFKSGSRWSDPRFEVVNGTPIWLYVYLLFRCGYFKTALEYVRRNQDFFQTDPGFIKYFQEYVESPGRSLEKTTRDAILADYQRLEYGQEAVDPYKLVLYKVVGRCALNKKTVSDIIVTTEDYMWLQLCLVHEEADSKMSGYEQYQLGDLQNLLLKYGSKRFDPHGSNPWTYFAVLLLSLQFERAIDYLYRNETSRMEAVHFAVALAYYGLLKAPEEPLKTSFDLLIFQHDRISLNFPRLIYQYARTFATTNPENAFQYIYLITLYADPQNLEHDDMVTLCQSSIRDLVLSSKDYKMVLGSRSPEQGRQPGLLDRNRRLLGVTSEKAFLKAVLLPIAEKYALAGKYDEAAYVYELSADYNKVVDVLIKQLSDILQQLCAPSLIGNANSTAGKEEQLMNLSVQTLERYQRQQHIGSVIDEQKKEAALYEIEKSGAIPLKDDLGQVQRSADLFELLDDNITKNIPEVLVMVSDMLHKEWKASSGPSLSFQGAAKRRVRDIEQNIQAVLSFVGSIRFKLPADTVVQLNRMEMAMSGSSGAHI